MVTFLVVILGKDFFDIFVMISQNLINVPIYKTLSDLAVSLNDLLFDVVFFVSPDKRSTVPIASGLI